MDCGPKILNIHPRIANNIRMHNKLPKGCLDDGHLLALSKQYNFNVVLHTLGFNYILHDNDVDDFIFIKHLGNHFEPFQIDSLNINSIALKSVVRSENDNNIPPTSPIVINIPNFGSHISPVVVRRNLELKRNINNKINSQKSSSYDLNSIFPRSTHTSDTDSVDNTTTNSYSDLLSVSSDNSIGPCSLSNVSYDTVCESSDNSTNESCSIGSVSGHILNCHNSPYVEEGRLVNFVSNDPKRYTKATLLNMLAGTNNKDIETSGNMQELTMNELNEEVKDLDFQSYSNLIDKLHGTNRVLRVGVLNDESVDKPSSSFDRDLMQSTYNLASTNNRLVQFPDKKMTKTDEYGNEVTKMHLRGPLEIFNKSYPLSHITLDPTLQSVKPIKVCNTHTWDMCKGSSNFASNAYDSDCVAEVLVKMVGTVRDFNTIQIIKKHVEAHFSQYDNRLMTAHELCQIKINCVHQIFKMIDCDDEKLNELSDRKTIKKISRYNSKLLDGIHVRPQWWKRFIPFIKRNTYSIHPRAK